MKTFLFICTHNRCRSILSEAITNHLAAQYGQDVQAFSAGSQPVGEVHPLSIKYLQERNIATEGLCSQSWDAYEDKSIDVVITVCDSAANEVCPVWFNDCQQIHWGLPDPSKLQGADEDVRQAFFAVMDTIENRMREVMKLELAAMDNAALSACMANLAQV
ncbi:Glutaredoxin arsenate reductase [Thalassocella blandensis]|nr:Glutaredoxin arsenate reductase [Thalassocella blandensis]